VRIISCSCLFNAFESSTLGNGGGNDLGGGRRAGLVGKPSVLKTFLSGCRRKAKADWTFKKLGLIRGAAFFVTLLLA
jgi:hypothetical protein